MSAQQPRASQHDASPNESRAGQPQWTTGAERQAAARQAYLQSVADGTPLTLRATPAANEALGIEPKDRGTPPEAEAAAAPESNAPSDSAGPRATTKGERGRGRARSGPKATGAAASARKGKGGRSSTNRKAVGRAGTSASRTGTKQAELVAMLRRPGGASLEEIITATGWQPHTIRGAIAGAIRKRLGLTVVSERTEKRGRVYRIQK